ETCGVKGSLFGGGDVILTAVVGFCIRDLGLARVRRDHLIKNGCEFNRRLAVTGCAIPRQLAGWGERSEIIEHFARITRTEFRVVSSLFREVVLKFHLGTLSEINWIPE